MKKLFVDIHIQQDGPVPGMYIVSIGKKGIGSVYLIHEVKISTTKKSWRLRYNLQVTVENEMKPYAVYDPLTNQVWVRGEIAQPVFWYKLNKKNKACVGNVTVPK